MTFMLGFLTVLVGLSLLVLVHELGHFSAAKWFGMHVLEFGIGFPPRLFSWKYHETRYSVNALPLGGFVKLHGELDDAGDRSFVRYPAWPRAIVLLAGVAMNFLAGWAIFSAVFWIGSPSALLVEAVMPGSPAERAGLEAGDIIADFPDAAGFISFVNAHAGQPLSFDVLREGSTVRVAAVPREHAPPAEGALGIALRESGAPPSGFFAGIYRGFLVACSISSSVVSGLAAVFREPAQVVGPVGIFAIATHAGTMGISYVLQLLGVISLNLAVLNLLPIPALDGGRLLFVAIEAVRGRKFAPRAELRANAAGFMLLILLIVIVTVKDVGALF